MKRLTFDGRFCDLAVCQEPQPCKYHDTGCSQRNTWERLKDIEDILGEDYDPRRLRELWEADRDGRTVVIPCHIGDGVYQIINKFTFTEDAAFLVPIIEAAAFDWDMIPKIGKSVFITHEEAEAAIERMRDND